MPTYVDPSACNACAGGHGGPHAGTQPVHGVQVPLYDAEGQPGFSSPRGEETDQVDPRALLAHHHTVHLHMTKAPPSAPAIPQPGFAH